MSYRRKRDSNNLYKSLKEEVLKHPKLFKGVDSKNKALKSIMLRRWIEYLKIEVYKSSSKILKETKKDLKYYRREINYLKNN
tara:strand:- start:59 stop:304 length:246 start_codon:yes stop_codon:yes gene_type:complete